MINDKQNRNHKGPPSTSEEFDASYRAPLTPWGDIRIPKELKTLAQQSDLKNVLELGCGVGRFARFMAQQGLQVTAVDFSGVAIGKARQRVAKDAQKPDFLIGDVTKLDFLQDPFDASYDVGCFHCLDQNQQKNFASEVARLLRPGGIHLMWAIDDSPSGISLCPAAISEVFIPYFELTKAESGRRRFARSHWYWLTRRYS